MCFFQDSLSYLVSFLLYFLRFIKIAFYIPTHLDQSHEYVLVYPSLRTKSVASSCTSNFGLDIYPGALDVKGHPCEIHETPDDSLAIVPNLVSPISLSLYKPLQL